MERSRYLDKMVGEGKAGRGVINALYANKEAIAKGRNPPHKIGLVIGGGAMAGVNSAATLHELNRLGLRDVFSAVASVSAGTANAAYFLSGQGESAIEIYFNHLSGRQFIDPFRPRRIMDMYHLEHVLRSTRPLREDVIKRQDVIFLAGVTNVQTGEGAMIDVGDSRDVVDTVLSSATPPILSDRALERQNIDGEIGIGMPLRAVIKQGCDMVLALFNFPIETLGKTNPKLEALLARLYLGKHRNLQRAIIRRGKVYEDSLRVLENMNIQTAINCPSEMQIGALTTDRNKLVRQAKQEMERARELFTL